MYEIANSLLQNDFENNAEIELLNNIIKFTKGKKPLNISNKEEKDYIKYLTIACLNNQEITYANPTKTIISEKDILMVMDGASSGEVYFSDYGIVGSTLAKIDIINESYTKEYIFFILKKYSELIKNKNTGSAIPHTDKAFVNTLGLPIISIEQQLKYKNILKKIQHNNSENINLIKLRDTLLPKLMNGEIDLDKIEI
ncbi:MAG: restriction endonuclease subunit S [Clostridia bacterium]|nr:restriction endonuclease subunit S [Clostridia bacterium]